jgi:hypothetical protein
MSVFLGQSPKTQKEGPMGQPLWEHDSMFFYTFQVELSLPLRIDLPYSLAPNATGGGGVLVVRKLAWP